MAPTEFRSMDFLKAPVDLRGFAKKSVPGKAVDVFHVAINAPTYLVAGLLAGYHALLRKAMGPLLSSKEKAQKED